MDLIISKLTLIVQFSDQCSCPINLIIGTFFIFSPNLMDLFIGNLAIIVQFSNGPKPFSHLLICFGTYKEVHGPPNRLKNLQTKINISFILVNLTHVLKLYMYILQQNLYFQKEKS